MKKVVVTGPTGAIGIALIHDLADHGVEVLAVCHKGSSRHHLIPKHKLVRVIDCSLDALTQLPSIVNQTDFDVFYHLAWMGTTAKFRNDLLLQEMNIHYALDAVKVAKELGCHRFIGVGSQAEYGRVDGMLSPNTPVHPESGYGMAKLCAGQMTSMRAQQLSMEHIWVRVLSVYGPNDDMQSMVMSTIYKLKYGEVPQFTPAEQLWDYLFSQDAATAFRLIGDHGKNGKVYVLGSGKVAPLQQYIEQIRDVVNPSSSLAIGALPYEKQQVMYLCADISDLVVDTGFKPKVTFSEGIRKIITSIQP